MQSRAQVYTCTCMYMYCAKMKCIHCSIGEISTCHLSSFTVKLASLVHCTRLNPSCLSHTVQYTTKSWGGAWEQGYCARYHRGHSHLQCSLIRDLHNKLSNLPSFLYMHVMSQNIVGCIPIQIHVVHVHAAVGDGCVESPRKDQGRPGGKIHAPSLPGPWELLRPETSRSLKNLNEVNVIHVTKSRLLTQHIQEMQQV